MKVFYQVSYVCIKSKVPQSLLSEVLWMREAGLSMTTSFIRRLTDGNAVSCGGLHCIPSNDLDTEHITCGSSGTGSYYPYRPALWNEIDFQHQNSK